MNKKNLSLILLALIPLILTVFMFKHLPLEIPMNWGFNGHVTYGSRNQIWFLAAMPLILAVLFMLIPKLDPRKSNFAKFSKYYFLISIIIILFTSIAFFIVLSEAFKPGMINVMIVVNSMTGILFTSLGVLMPKFRSNFFVGVRTPWTLSSDIVWDKTHKLAGIIWIIGGVLMTFLPFLNLDFYVFIFAGILGVMVLVPIIYSYVIYSKNQ